MQLHRYNVSGSMETVQLSLQLEHEENMRMSYNELCIASRVINDCIEKMKNFKEDMKNENLLLLKKKDLDRIIYKKDYNLEFAFKIDGDIYLLCPNCQKFDFIKFENENQLQIECDKSGIIVNKNINFIFDNYIFNSKENKTKEDIKNYLNCSTHKKKYKYYCKTCKKDLCKLCCNKGKEHQKHEIVIFDSLFLDFSNHIKIIKDILNIKKEEYKENNNIKNNLKKEDYFTFKNLVKIIINNNYQYPCYNYFKTIENIYHLVLYKNNNSLKDITIENIQDIKIIKNPELITSISIINQAIKDIKQICNANLNNLHSLELQDNNIDDISPLANANFQNLRHLDISNNKIDDKNISFFQKMNFKKLTHLNICSNCLSNFDFFKNIIYFPELNTLLVSSNKFNSNNIDKIITNNNYYDLTNIIEIGLSDIFSDESIKIINNFKFKKLEILYLNQNNINSLSFIEKLELPNLKEIWLNYNNLENYELLTKFKNLQRIELKNNKITNINNLYDFVKKFLKLQKINIKGNNFDIEEKNNKNALNYIIDKTQIKIIYNNTDLN